MEKQTATMTYLDVPTVEISKTEMEDEYILLNEAILKFDLQIQDFVRKWNRTGSLLDNIYTECFYIKNKNSKQSILSRLL